MASLQLSLRIILRILLRAKYARHFMVIVQELQGFRFDQLKKLNNTCWISTLVMKYTSYDY